MSMTINNIDVSEILHTENLFLSLWASQNVRGNLKEITRVDEVLAFLSTMFDKGSLLKDKCLILIKSIQRGLTNPENYLWNIQGQLNDLVSTQRYHLLKAMLADFTYRALTLEYPSIDKDQVSWQDAKGFKISTLSEPVGIYWPAQPGRSDQILGKDPVYFEWASFGQIPRLFQFPSESEPILFCGRRYPWIARGV